MGNGKVEKFSKSKKSNKVKTSIKNPKINFKKKGKQRQPPLLRIETNDNKEEKTNHNNNDNNEVPPASGAEQLSFFLNEFQSANGVQLSSLELESITDKCFVELSQELGQDVNALGKHMKVAFGPTWKEVLCEGQLVEGKVDAGSPAVLIISTSALRSLELLRGVRSLTGECRAVKLFSKHMKVEEQLGNSSKLVKLVEGTAYADYIQLHVALLKNRVNFASGTPSRVKKLIDIEALGLTRLAMVVLDMHTDVKGYSLLTLPQVSGEFWDLYKNYLHQRLVQGDLRILLLGPLPNGNELKGKKRKDSS